MAEIKLARRVVKEWTSRKRPVIVIFPDNGACIDCSKSCCDPKEDKPYQDLKKKYKPKNDRD